MAAMEAVSTPPVAPLSHPEQSILDNTVNADAIQADAMSVASTTGSKVVTTTTKVTKKVKRKPTAKEKRERGVSHSNIPHSTMFRFCGRLRLKKLYKHFR
jgi:hypothetical protein